MNCNVFEQLLIEKIENFKSAFLNTSEQVFYNTEGKLIHPGEYGRYRENVCKEFLKFIIPSRLDIGQGFIINTWNNISHQCDIVVYDPQNTPLIESSERQFFYPIETVVAVGEIKSTLSKTALKEAINKLSNVKRMREQIKNPVIIKGDESRNRQFNPLKHPYDQLFTFIICKKFDFDPTNLANEINNMYDTSVEFRHRHNLILSIEDGLLAYYDDNDKTMMYPLLGVKNRFTYPTENPYVHFKLFASYLFMGTTNVTILYPEFTDYMGTIEGGFKINEP